MTVKEFIRPGDALLYWTPGVFSWVIAVKTWHKVAHIEVYAGSGMSFASRNGQGVDLYPLRTDGLVRVLRSNQPFDLASAAAWFQTVRGEKYDWWGLLRFFTIGAGKPDRMFCSECATRVYRHGGIEPFQPDSDADIIAPGSYLDSAVFPNDYVVNGDLLTPKHALNAKGV